jgi:hypothetical protein
VNPPCASFFLCLGPRQVELLLDSGVNPSSTSFAETQVQKLPDRRASARVLSSCS